MQESTKTMKERVEFLNEARKAYEQENREIISNIEYDKLYDELVQLEKETGIVLGNSPTANVGYEVLSDLPKEAHASPMLSLDKTKEVGTLISWLGDRTGLLSWKLDGLTIVLTYEGGKLVKAVTRGNGEIGEVITGNVKVFKNVPVNIPYKGRLVLRGEAIIKYSDFEKLNKTISDIDSKYKNPRNLCSGTVRQLNNEITAQRNVNFYGFSLVEAADPDGADFGKFRKAQLEWLNDQGFETVEFKVVTAETLQEEVENFAKAAAGNDIPSDGLVLIYDDIEYGHSLGSTSKFPRDSIAFKWRDELEETTLKEIQWSASRTGQINPIAVFEPVQLEGTTVSRASVHNVSILKELALSIGDKISVYKANMIIPQISENLTRQGEPQIPDKCPVCEQEAVVKKDNDVEVLFCTNPKCLAKQIKSISHFASRNAMNIEGFSEATIEKFVDLGYIKQFADIFRLERYRDVITATDGFGEKSYENLIASVNKARKTTPAKFLYSLGVSNIGVANAKLIAGASEDSWERMMALTEEELIGVDGIGDVMAESYVKFFEDPDNLAMVSELLKEIELEGPHAADKSSELEGKTFVITGSLGEFENRDALKEFIEKKGGKTSSSVSSKTTYLINNDFSSDSSKNKKAKELGVEIITEKQFLEMV